MFASVFAAEAMHIGSLIAAQGYFFPISDHVLSLKDDGTFYRFQVNIFFVWGQLFSDLQSHFIEIPHKESSGRSIKILYRSINMA